MMRLVQKFAVCIVRKKQAESLILAQLADTITFALTAFWLRFWMMTIDLACLGKRVVSSSRLYYNSAQPFIRYDQGDLASWGKPCSCGITLPVIEKIDGRIYHLFKRPDGTRSGGIIPESLRSNLHAEFWQFVQTGVNHVEVRYKPVGGRDKQLEERFAALLTSLYLQGFEISYKIIKNLPLTTGGKFIKYVNET